MRPRDRILANLEATYRDSYEKAKAEGITRRMEELDWAYQRDQLMLEILLDVRDLLSRRRLRQGRRAPMPWKNSRRCAASPNCDRDT